jgi:hypothetical protein
VSFEVGNIDEVARQSVVITSIYKAIAEADIVIADISQHNPSVMYELGFAHARGKPTIIIAQDTERIPFDVAHHRTLLYDRSQLNARLVPRLAEVLREAHKTPAAFVLSETSIPSPQQNPTVFVSYSHADKECLKRLQVHLRPLERLDLVDVWADTRIKAGARWKEEIADALDRAAIALLLISADFLASDFIVDNELPPLLSAAAKKGTKILSLVLAPCRFDRDEHLSQFQSINPPSEPILNLEPVERDYWYNQASKEIELLVRARGGPKT